MNLYLIEQCINTEYDTYDSAVVVADSEEEARKIHPNLGLVNTMDDYDLGEWTTSDNVKATLIGVATLKEKGVVLASFNAS